MADPPSDVSGGGPEAAAGSGRRALAPADSPTASLSSPAGATEPARLDRGHRAQAPRRAPWPLRTRLATLAAAATLVIVAVAGVLIAIERWNEVTGRLESAATTAAFELADGPSPAIVPAKIDIEGADQKMVLWVDEFGEIVERQGAVSMSSGLDDLLVEDLWFDLVDLESAVALTYDPVQTGTTSVHAAGARCFQASVCDSVIVAATPVSFGGFLLPRIGWIIAPALAAAAAAAVATRAAVGRSLRPVESMRSGFAAITTADLSSSPLPSGAAKTSGGRPDPIDSDRTDSRDRPDPVGETALRGAGTRGLEQPTRLRVPVPETGDEIEALANTFNDTIARLAVAVQANERFVADAAHELRSPLAGVRAAVEVEAQARSSDLLDDAIDELDRAARLVDDLLTLSKAANPAGARRVDVDLDDLARAACRQAEARHQTQVRCDASPARVSADPDGLARILVNLIDNACRYGNGRVDVTVDATGDHAWIHVDDDGRGIAPEDRRRVLDRFVRLDESRARATGGSGLGLAIAAELATANGAVLTLADSQLGGLRATVAFARSSSGR